MDRFIVIIDAGTKVEFPASQIFDDQDEAQAYCDRYLRHRPYIIYRMTQSGIRKRSEKGLERFRPEALLS